MKHLSPRETRVVALGKPSDRDRASWYFQRYVPHLPAAQELVLFNRSWYNRAGVERVMGFCTEAEYEQFIRSVPDFENMRVRSGVKLFKYDLDVSRTEQRKRLRDRKSDPLQQWKVGPRADDTRLARLNLIKDLLGRLHYAGKDKRLLRVNRQIVSACTESKR